jgi:hypothetical protein
MSSRCKIRMQVHSPLSETLEGTLVVYEFRIFRILEW